MADSADQSRAALGRALRPGRVRTNNEDLPVLDAERGIFGVIDGVGGHAAGELAAAIARDVILQRLARPLGTPAERVREAIAIANNEIFRRAAAEPDARRHDVRGHAGGGGRRPRDGRPRRRQPALQAAAVRPAQADARPFAGRRARGRAARLGEIEAMHHPRRHEVFRDVGSALRDKDEPEYVEVDRRHARGRRGDPGVQRRADRHDPVDDDRPCRAAARRRRRRR